MKGRCICVSASPLARLVDYLAWQHGLLFVISAGNRADNVTLHGVPLGGLSSSTRDARHAAAMTCLAREAVERRIRPPAEALNALTVGASHDDLQWERRWASQPIRAGC